ncbi:hypothetical protein [Bacillus sp. ISL-75]|uniref:hypothetical protein n=1 Tax=Bacillus sp. ISL-75 TaxID=2819137 RepID=UPI0027E0E8F9|nr:hypothetical protein [Bacillus sp. ISL-75]
MGLSLAGATVLVTGTNPERTKKVTEEVAQLTGREQTTLLVIYQKMKTLSRWLKKPYINGTKSTFLSIIPAEA